MRIPESDNNTVRVFEFPLMPYYPMDLDEVSHCMQGFTETVVDAINQLHRLGFAHADIRLPNICFNDRFEAVLIDFDRAIKQRVGTATQDWVDFAAMLSPLKGRRCWTDAWDAFCALMGDGNEPDLSVLVHVRDEQTVANVLRRRAT